MCPSIFTENWKASEMHQSIHYLALGIATCTNLAYHIMLRHFFLIILHLDNQKIPNTSKTLSQKYHCIWITNATWHLSMRLGNLSLFLFLYQTYISSTPAEYTLIIIPHDFSNYTSWTLKIYFPQTEYWQLLDAGFFNSVTIQTSDKDTDCIHLLCSMPRTLGAVD